MTERDKKGRFLKGCVALNKGILRVRPPIQCKLCGKIFRPFHYNSQYCSRKCYNESGDMVNIARKNLEYGRKIKRQMSIGHEYPTRHGYVKVFSPYYFDSFCSHRTTKFRQISFYHCYHHINYPFFFCLAILFMLSIWIKLPSL